MPQYELEFDIQVESNKRDRKYRVFLNETFITSHYGAQLSYVPLTILNGTATVDGLCLS